MTDLRALIFDVDGTLADTEEVHRIAFNKAFANKGLDWQWSQELYSDLLAVTGGKERIRHYVTSYLPEYLPEDQLGEFAADLHKEKTAIYTEMMAGGEIKLRPGIERLINEARGEGLKLAIATTTTLENVEALLVNALAPDAMAWFDVVGAGDVVAHKKPASDIYDYALAKLQLTPEQCIAFEDSENGIKASTGAKLKTIITVNHYTQDHEFPGAAIVLNQMGEPDRPFTVLSGDAMGHSYLNLDLVKKLHRDD